MKGEMIMVVLCSLIILFLKLPDCFIFIVQQVLGVASGVQIYEKERFLFRNSFSLPIFNKTKSNEVCMRRRVVDIIFSVHNSGVASRLYYTLYIKTHVVFESTATRPLSTLLCLRYFKGRVSSTETHAPLILTFL